MPFLSVRIYWSFLDNLRYFVIVPTIQTNEDRSKSIIFEGGPMDGQSWAELDGDEANVLMSDGQKHRYVRTTEFLDMPDGSLAQVFNWTGRYYGAE